MQQPGRLPGDLPVRTAYWYLLRTNVGLVATAGVLAGAGVGMYALMGWALGGPVVSVLAGLGVLASMLVDTSRPGVAVRPTNQPQLYELVDDVARRAGLRPPRRIWLTARPELTVRVVDRRRELCVGLALLACLTETELRALLAHELTLLNQPHAWAVVRLLNRWSLALAGVAATADDEKPGRKDVRTVAELSPMAAQWHRQADAAAGDAAALARAIVVVAAVEYEYERYLDDMRQPVGPWWISLDRVLTDLDDGWRVRLAHGITPLRWDEDAAALLSRQHASLASWLTAWGDDPLPLTLVDGVPVAPLTPAAARRLGVRAYELKRRQVWGWTTIGAVPDSRWSRRASTGADVVRSRVAELLGRSPRDDAEVAEVLLARPLELFGWTTVAPSPDAAEAAADLPFEPRPLLIDLVEDNLLQRGWRLEHPALRGVLIGPAGERVDVDTIIGRTVSAPELSALRALLGGPVKDIDAALRD